MTGPPSASISERPFFSVLVIGVLVELFCQAAPGTIVSLLLSGDSALFDETVSAPASIRPVPSACGPHHCPGRLPRRLGQGRRLRPALLGRGFSCCRPPSWSFYLLGASAMIWTAALIGELLSLGLGLFLLRRNEAEAKKELDT